MVLRELAAGRTIEAHGDVHVSPTYVPDLAHAALDLLIDRVNGIWHLTNQGVTSWHEFAERVAREAGMDTSAILRTHGGGRGMTALSSERGLILPSFTSAVERYVRENTIAWNDDASGRAAA
jgi:dTDP-4-dehydrorhamnose reductase